MNFLRRFNFEQNEWYVTDRETERKIGLLQKWLAVAGGDMCRMRRELFWFWFDVKNDFYLNSQWPWPLTSCKFAPPVNRVPRVFTECEASIFRRHAADKQTDGQSDRVQRSMWPLREGCITFEQAGDGVHLQCRLLTFLFIRWLAS